MQEAHDAAIAVRANMVRLRMLRLAKEAEAVPTGIARANKVPRTKSK